MARPFAFKETPSQERLKLLLDYDPESGVLRWKEREASSFIGLSEKKASAAAKHWNKTNAGREVTAPNDGYIRLCIDKTHHYAQRIVWKMCYGTDPVQVDHINGEKSDNRLENLRNVSQQVNAKNRRLYKNNATGVNGVSFHKRDGVWCARISVGGGTDVHLGSFPSKDEAIAARIAAEIVLEYHPNHGRQPELERGK